jgi:hypothetical protein
MRLVANFEIKAHCSVVSDDLRLEIRHPQGACPEFCVNGADIKYRRDDLRTR